MEHRGLGKLWDEQKGGQELAAPERFGKNEPGCVTGCSQSEAGVSALQAEQPREQGLDTERKKETRRTRKKEKKKKERKNGEYRGQAKPS